MKLGPRPTGQPWTPGNDAQLLVLLEKNVDRALIARKLKRTVTAINTRKCMLKRKDKVTGETEINRAPLSNP